MSLSCFHCNNEFEQQDAIEVNVQDKVEQVCCLGCKAVTEHILGSGLASYYQFRTEAAVRPTDVDNSLYQAYDDDKLLNLVAHRQGDEHVILLTVDNIHCAACAWLIEQALTSLGDGIKKVSVNTINQRADITWDQNEITISKVLSRLAEIGYPASPFMVSDAETSIKKQEKLYIKRLGVAGLFTMQVMMLAFAMYFGAFENMESHQVGYFKWLSMLLSVPVVFYSAIPFAKGAVSSAKSRQLNMDVPVALAIFGAFAASLWQLILNGLDGEHGEVFFESICMFTFLLLVGKYLEFRAKSKAVLSNANLNATLPVTVNLIDENGNHLTSLLQEVNIGDRVLIKPGEQCAVDGVILNGRTSLNESVLNGEFAPINKQVGDIVYAGSVNNDGVITVKVTAVGLDTTLAQVGQMQSEFAKHKPQYTEYADRIAHWFVSGQLILAALTYVIWYFVSPVDALWVSLSVLVATCPCALSLATPTAYTCVMSALNSKGILIKEPASFDKLNQASVIAFDKTGTLTYGQFVINNTRWLTNDKLAPAAVKLQQHSEHPIAKAFSAQAFNVSDAKLENIKLADVNVHVGKGVTALFNGHLLALGSKDFIFPQLNGPVEISEDITVESTNGSQIYMAYKGELHGIFSVEDQLKQEVPGVITKLQHQGIEPMILTGDSSTNAIVIANKLGVSSVSTGCSPRVKGERVLQKQQQENTVVMVGDGINDAPVFAAADISIAMGQGATVTKMAADILILKGNLDAISMLLNAAKRTRKVIRNNLKWSIIYNIVILPAAMLGWVAPYIAVIGMSASSILVVTNSLKLLNVKETS